jgi:hypothetical protein
MRNGMIGLDTFLSFSKATREKKKKKKKGSQNRFVRRKKERP